MSVSSKDKTLRNIFQEIPQRLLKILTPIPVVELLDTVLPSTELRADLLAKLQDKSLLHLELQSFNDPNIPWRMLKYFTAIAEKYSTTRIRQLVVYVGNEPLRMKNSLELERLSFEFEMVDLRSIDCKLLLQSPDPLDRIMACLCRVEDEEYLIKKIMEAMEGMNEGERKDYIMKLLTVSELRPKLRVRLSAEVRHMPIVVRPEDINLSEEEMKKDILYNVGLLKDAQDAVLTVIEGRLGYVPKGVEDKVRDIRDREYLHNLIKRLVSTEDVLGLLRKEFGRGKF